MRQHNLEARDVVLPSRLPDFGTMQDRPEERSTKSIHTQIGPRTGST